MHAALIWGVALASIALMLIRPLGQPELVWAGGGAVLLVVLGLVPIKLAAHAVGAGVDVYLFLTGMMVLSELARLHGVFAWLAGTAIRLARGSRVRLFTLLYGVGTLVTIFMSNDATAVVLTPAVLAAVKKCRAEPLPYLLSCALIANAASFVLPISNPANLVVYHDRLPPLGRWLAAFAPASALSIGATYLLLRWRSRAALVGPLHTTDPTEPLSGPGKLTLLGIGLVTAVLLAASALGKDLGLPTFLTVAAVTLGISLRDKTPPRRILGPVSWSVLPLVAALFILVDAVQSVGALDWMTRGLKAAGSVGSPGRLAGPLIVAFAVGTATNLLNNLPLGLLAGATVQAAHVQGPLARAVLLGIDLGPNLSVTGSLATLLWLIAIRREGMDVGFGTFLKAGLIVMPPALALATAAIAWTR